MLDTFQRTQFIFIIFQFQISFHNQITIHSCEFKAYINYSNSYAIKKATFNFSHLYFFQKPIDKLLYTAHPVQQISYFYFMKILLKIKISFFNSTFLLHQPRIKYHYFQKEIECARFLYLLYSIAEYFDLKKIELAGLLFPQLLCCRNLFQIRKIIYESLSTFFEYE
ncbi:unnamed protein product [Paramecium pentaurelia]|uniref:Uncharacterized protein n=1 Tax=Paramecium pentaurelia TaxID=43138 RepID=A0A8S1S739_9CILI|nr:unnamed protein product [Paramecium pentaurelia]